jgi:hypothetical protein
MTTWWDEKAARVQQGVRGDEIDLGRDYSENEARRAAVCAREDMVMVVVHLSTVNHFLSGIRRWLIALTVVAIAICIRLYWGWVTHL